MRTGMATALMTISALTMSVVEAPAVAGRPSPVDAQQAIQETLDASARAWSKGDLETFMKCYENSATTVYVSRGTVTSGYDRIRTIYAERFGEDGSAMGELSITILDFRMIDPAHAFIIGRFRLHREGSGDAEGLTTLLFHKTSAGWRIIADHS